MTEAGCWAHARRKFFELAELRKAPLAVEAVRRIDAIFVITHPSCQRDKCLNPWGDGSD